MAVKIHKPTSPGRRNSSVSSFDEITVREPEKSLVRGRKRTGGRGMHGKITVRHRGGGVKRLYRTVDFRVEKLDVPAEVRSIEYDPHRSAYLALVEYKDGEKRYMVAPLALKVGDTVLVSKSKIDINAGNRMPIGEIPSGIMVHNLELFPGGGGRLVRSAGSGATILATEGPWTTVKLPSGEMRRFPRASLATVGQVSNSDWRNVRWGKAGRMRLKGWRPTVRGKAMNPVDHPHGGGEGNQPIGLRKGPKTPWGKLAMGVKTRRPGKASNAHILRRRNA